MIAEIKTEESIMSVLRDLWLENYRGKVHERDFALLDKASRILEGNIAPQTDVLPWAPLRGICPSYHFPGVWNWDAAFIAMGVSRWDVRLAQEQAEIFYRFQREDGLFPDYIHKDKDYKQDAFGKPPVWPWAVEVMDRRVPDNAFLRRSWDPLVKNETFWRTQRFSEQDGLFFYGASTQGKDRDLHIRYESGWDNSVRWDAGIEHIYPVDLNCFMLTFYRSMRYIAFRLDKTEEALAYSAKEEALRERILAALWDEEAQCFYDYDFAAKAFVRVLTPASFMPLWVGIASGKQAAAMNVLASDPEKLFPGMPTVSYDDPEYKEDSYWRGPTWINVAYFAAKGLYDYGFRKTSMTIRDTLLNWMAKDESIHENYDGKTGAPLCSAEFSWSSAFAMEMILEMR